MSTIERLAAWISSGVILRDAVACINHRIANSTCLGSGRVAELELAAEHLRNMQSAIAQAAAEDAAKTREILALRDALTWYRGIAKEMQKACLHQDSKHMLKLMQELAVDGGSKAKAAITPSPQSDQEEA